MKRKVEDAGAVIRVKKPLQICIRRLSGVAFAPLRDKLSKKRNMRFTHSIWCYNNIAEPKGEA